ncbi:MAG: hypothetical protein ACT4O5_06535 [Gammaproteobacteria bacterium]
MRRRIPLSTACCLVFASWLAATGDSLAAQANDLPTHNIAQQFRSRDSAAKFIDQLRMRASMASTDQKEESLTQLGEGIRLYLDHERQAPQLEESQRRGLLQEAVASYVEAAELALAQGRIRYSRQVSELAQQIGDKALLVRVFAKYLTNYSDERGRYVALIDFAVGLAKFRDSSVARHFDEAIYMRRPRDSVEAHVRYAQYLIDGGQPQVALDVLNRFDAVDRQFYFNVALMRQRLMHSLGLDTSAADEEMSKIRRTTNGTWGVGPIPKVTAKVAASPKNILGLMAAQAFAHTESSDDSRGPLANQFLYAPSGQGWSRTAVNASEVVYNEARGESQDGRIAVAWSIRNRALINMNGCDFYPGAEGHGGAEACRNATPNGPQSNVGYIWANKRWSCAVHGGTSSVGGSHDQMNDGHVPIATLEPTGILVEVFWVGNGVVADKTSQNTPSGSYLPLRYPNQPNYWSGNPAGGQEWRSNNYCAANNSCKVRLGNVGGNLPDPGSPCPNSGGSSGDNFFWGRKP